MTNQDPGFLARGTILLYHFVQLVSAVTRDQLDEILVSSFGYCSRDILKFLSEFVWWQNNRILFKKEISFIVN